MSSSSITPSASETATRYRWTICLLLFYITTANYNDRAVFSNLAPDLGRQIGWTEPQYWLMQVAFQCAYAVSAILAGRLIDTLGLRLGFSLAVGFWGLAAMSHSLATTTTHFFIVRILLGLGEGGLFPAAAKAVAEWFPNRERALATSLFNAGSNFGAIIVPLGVPFLIPLLMQISVGGEPLGWRGAFLLTGLFDLSWIFLWLSIYKSPDKHPRVNGAELALINSEPPEPSVKIPWRSLFPHRQTWAYTVAKGTTDGIWWFYLNGAAYFLSARFGMNLAARGGFIAAIYVPATVGGVLGGWYSGHLMRRGWTANKARKITMLIAAFLVTPIFWAAITPSVWLAVALLSLAASAHQAWSANVMTLPSDMFPRRIRGSVSGLGGAMGAAGGVLLMLLIYQIRQQAIAQGTPGDYAPIFACVSVTYLVALAVAHLLAPTLEPAQIEAATAVR